MFVFVINLDNNILEILLHISLQVYCKLLSLQETLTKQHIFKEKLFFCLIFFHGNRNSTEKVFFFAIIVELNGQNNCIKSFTRSKYKEKQGTLLAASWKDSIISSQKNPIKCEALFPQWYLKACKFYNYQGAIT